MTTKQKKYTLQDTVSGYGVLRTSDGAIAEFLDSAGASEAIGLLERGQREESDFEWRIAADSEVRTGTKQENER